MQRVEVITPTTLSRLREPLDEAGPVRGPLHGGCVVGCPQVDLSYDSRFGIDGDKPSVDITIVECLTDGTQSNAKG
jgi:hypothetical protein